MHAASSRTGHRLRARNRAEGPPPGLALASRLRHQPKTPLILPIRERTTREWASVGDGEKLDTLTVPIPVRKLIIDVAGTRDLYPIRHDRDFAKATAPGTSS